MKRSREPYRPPLSNDTNPLRRRLDDSRLRTYDCHIFALRVAGNPASREARKLLQDWIQIRREYAAELRARRKP